MDSETFKSRLLRLLQKSRQAFRLYESMGRAPQGESSEFTELQAAEWRNVNALLIKELSSYLDRPHQRELAIQVFALRDRFLNEFRIAETELHARQKELIFAAEKGDFVKGALLSRRLVVSKARLQANQAAQHELDGVIAQSKLSEPAIILSKEQALPDSAPAESWEQEEVREERLAPVIPLRRKQYNAM